MNPFKITITKLNDEIFLASYTHPVLKQRLRLPFSSENEVREFKKQMIKKLDRKNLKQGNKLTIEDLLCFFVQDHPNSTLAKNKYIHASDFAKTFGNYFPHELTTPMLMAWLTQVKKEHNLKKHHTGINQNNGWQFFYLSC